MPILPKSLSKSPFSLHSPLLFSTPNADAACTSDNDPAPSQENLTQEFLERLRRLRHDDVIVADEARPALLALQRETDDLRSELVAARLQLEEKDIEIQELRDQLLALSSPSDVLLPFISKSRKKEMKKRQRNEAAVAAANATQPPGCDTGSLPPQPPPPPPRPNQRPAQQPTQHQVQQQQQHPSQPTIFIFHDSNVKNLTAEEVKNSINNININNNIKNYNISPQQTFTLPQTRNKIKQLTFKTNDIVIINTITNDARQTKYRQARTKNETKHIQATIITHIKAFIPPKNIVILESPPLLTSSTSDIFPYNDASFQLSRHHGARFARSLLGEHHLFSDGFHILHTARHLLVKSIAAAAMNIDPHKHFRLKRPPHGNFGPWEAPNGQGMLPKPLTYRGVAVAQPINFRRSQIRPLMQINIRRNN